MIKNLLFILCLTTVSLCSSQNERKDAERLFDNIFPVGITIGYQWNEFVNTNTTGYDYGRNDDNSYLIGLDYNFAQTGRFNFSGGVFYKELNSSAQLLIPITDNGGTSGSIFSYDRDISMFSFHLKSEFVKEIIANNFLSVSLSFQGNLINNDALADTRLGYSTTPDSMDAVAFINFSSARKFEMMIPISLAYYYKSSNIGLFKIDLSHSFRNTYIFGDDVTNVNLDEGMGTFSFHQWRGGYTALSFSWFPKWSRNKN